MNSFTNNLKPIQTVVARACKQAERNQKDVTVIAVSKKQPPEKMRQALESGHRHFGENRVQEAVSHWHDIRTGNEYTDIHLHLIGPLQSNKAADAVALFDTIHTVDRKKIARVLAEEQEKQKRTLKYFIQVNTGEEDQKSGVTPADLPDLLKYATQECGLNVVGLMAIPPVNEAPALHFALLRKLAHENGLTELSMGMSDDYETAVLFDASYIRIGTALFGERQEK